MYGVWWVGVWSSGWGGGESHRVSAYLLSTVPACDLEIITTFEEGTTKWERLGRKGAVAAASGKRRAVVVVG